MKNARSELVEIYVNVAFLIFRGHRKKLKFFSDYFSTQHLIFAQIINAFELWCWRESLGLQEVETQSILKKITPEYSLEGLMLKVKLQYFGNLMHKTDSLEKALMLRKIEGRRRRG